MRVTKVHVSALNESQTQTSQKSHFSHTFILFTNKKDYLSFNILLINISYFVAYLIVLCTKVLHKKRKITKYEQVPFMIPLYN